MWYIKKMGLSRQVLASILVYEYKYKKERVMSYEKKIVYGGFTRDVTPEKEAALEYFKMI